MNAPTRAYLRADDDGVVIECTIATRSSRPGLLGERNGRLRLGVSAPPVDGRANDELVELLAGLLRCPKRSIEIIAGLSSKNKRLKISGLTVSGAAALLDDALNND